MCWGKKPLRCKAFASPHDCSKSDEVEVTFNAKIAKLLLMSLHHLTPQPKVTYCCFFLLKIILSQSSGQKDCTHKPRSGTMVISNGDNDTMQGYTKGQKQSNNKKIAKSKKTKAKHLQVEVRLVCSPPGWFMVSIPDGIA